MTVSVRRLLPGVLALGVAGSLAAAGLLTLDGRDTPDSSDVEHAPQGPPVLSSDLRNGRVFIQDNLWSTETEQVAVWVGGDGTPHVGRRQRGSDRWEIDDLSRVAGDPLNTPVDDNPHNTLAVGRDAGGRIYVAGNMRRDPFRGVLWESTRGWTPMELGARSEEMTYPGFVRSRDGALSLFWREGIAGDAFVRFARLAPSSDSWKQMGTLIDGRPTGESPYLHQVASDPRTGTLHIMFTWRSEGLDPDTTNDVGYARSPDGGRSWETSTGEPLSLPITHETAEIALETPPEGSGLRNSGGVAVDTAGRPHGVLLFLDGDGSARHDHIWHDGRRWHRDTLPGGLVSGRVAVAATSDGRVWMLGVYGTELRAVDITPESAERNPVGLARVPEGWEVTYDSRAVELYDTIEILVPAGDVPHVVVFDPVGTGDTWVERPVVEMAGAEG